MKPSTFFEESQIVRDYDFYYTYAVGQKLDRSVAYAVDIIAVKNINVDSTISSVITTRNLANYVSLEKGLIISDKPQQDFYLLHNYMCKNNDLKLLMGTSIDPTAKIASTAVIEDNVVIGKNVTIEDFAIVRSNSVIENNCEIGAFCNVGAKSMQRTIVDGKLIQLEYAGGVYIKENSRVLTKAVLQKSYQAFYTEIGNNSVVSTNVIIGHGSKVGDRTMLSGNSAIAGNCVVGDDVWIGGGALVADRINIGNGAKVLVGSVVIKNVLDGQTVSGNFAIDHRKNLKHQITLK